MRDLMKLTPFLAAALSFSCAESEFQTSSVKNKRLAKTNSEDVAKDTTPQNRRTDLSNEVLSPGEAGEPGLLEQLFLSSSLANNTIEISKESAITETDFTLKVNTAPVTDTYNQVKRNELQQRFDQGAAAVTTTESFNSERNYSPVDIIVVIDDSGSMSQEQKQLAPKLGSLLTHIKDTKWQIMVVTTHDRDNPCTTGRTIKYTDSDPGEKFRNAIDIGIDKSYGNEKGIYQAKRALDCMKLQKDSTISVLIVSDEDNCSKGCKNVNQKPDSLIEKMKALRPAKGQRPAGGKLYGIIDIPDANGKSTCSTKTAHNVGKQYYKGIQASNGLAGNICATDYDGTLKDISKNIASNLNTFFTLKQDPVGGITVKMDKKATNNFTISGRNLTITNPSGDRFDLKVTYTTKASQMKNAFTLPKGPYAGSVKVKVNDVLTNNINYTVSGRTITFNSSPPANAVIIVDYLDENLNLKKSFDLTKTPTGTVTAYVNGIMKTSTVNAKTRVLTFEQAPPEFATIRLVYQENTGAILSYEVFSNTDDLDIVGVFPKGSSTKIDGATISPSGVVTVPANEFQENKVLSVHTQKPIAMQEIKLDQVPVGELEVVSSPCDPSDDIISLEGDILRIDCLIEDDNDPLVIAYKLEIEKTSVFPLNGEPEDDAEIEVLINGKPTFEYDIVGPQLIISQELAPESEILFRKTLP